MKMTQNYSSFSIILIELLDKISMTFIIHWRVEEERGRTS